MKNLWFLVVIVVLCSCAGTSAKNSSYAPEVIPETTIELRVDLSSDTMEIWEVKGIDKKCSFSDEKIHEAMRVTAAKKSSSEKMDCFGILDKDNKISSGTYEYNTTETMYGSKVGGGSYSGKASSYYGSNFLNSLNTSLNASGTSYEISSYQVPVTKTGAYCSEVKSWYLLFHDMDTCKELKTTIWRERVFYNKDVLESEGKRLEEEQKILEMKRKAENGTVQEYYEYLDYIKSK
jgi:hypothetical protein